MLWWLSPGEGLDAVYKMRLGYTVKMEQSNQKYMYGAVLAISENYWLYLVIFGMPLEPYYFEMVIVGLR